MAKQGRLAGGRGNYCGNHQYTTTRFFVKMFSFENFSTEVSPSAALPGEMLRMMYAMAIMRLVNGVVDQSVRRNTSSVANRAEDARLPRVFVDIRHETSHNELPSLPLVRHASKQALLWLQQNYWEEQEQLVPKNQGTLKTKLIQHAQVIYEILVLQQRLLSKETKGQDFKQQRLPLKRALKGLKRQQQALLRELLELTCSGTSELIFLLVKEGLLVHDLNPSCSSPTPSIESFNDESNGEFDELPDSPSSSDGLGFDERPEDNSVAAWKHTCVQLTEHLPHLPALLLSSIVASLTAMFGESTSKKDQSGNLATSFCKEELVDWATWILDQSSALPKKKKAHSGLPKFIETGADLQMHAVFPQNALKEIAHLCMRCRMEKESLVKLISRLSPLVNDSSFRRRAELLAKCSLSFSNDVKAYADTEESGRSFVDRLREPDSAQNEADGELNLDTALVKAREMQQMAMAKYVANLKASEHIRTMKPPPTAGPWSKAKSWIPCAIGMLPSAHDYEAILPRLDLEQKTSTPVEDDQTGEISMSTHEVQSFERNVSDFSYQGCGQGLKRKAFEAHAEVGPEIDSKRTRVEDQPMNEAKIAGHDNSVGSDVGNEEHLLLTDGARGMECDDETIEPMNEEQSFLDDRTVEDDADKLKGNIDCETDLSLSFGFKMEEVPVAWQGCLLQRGVLQLGALQELPNLQAAIRVL
ncbi:uncharacterized protein [Physcomitrium patens]|uniref:Las1-like family protein n=1 Tax=Physcomitrium patens TaxID=3218 RepID=A0A7I4DTP1_PHYPA|nr:uncharacterized protein LOC112282440 isoform X2 [Physcomitrium patens]|eukprot:XP_024375786.1 uncharacterized protein LOC112282440 isoform X2 [Physcomitrella patens]